MDNEEESCRDVLPKGFLLHWYEVQPVLGRGAFGVTYLARAFTSLVTCGYALFEQYNDSEEKQGPWTDVYALGTSLFFWFDERAAGRVTDPWIRHAVNWY